MSKALTNQSGLTLIETLVAMVILFVGVGLALRLQTNLNSVLQVDDLDRAILFADSLLLDCENNSFDSDTLYVVNDDAKNLTASVTVDDSAGLQKIRIVVVSDGATQPVHQLYREIEKQD